MNNISIIGRLVAKPELRYTTNNKSFCFFSVACNGLNSEVDYIDCTAWGKQAENLCNYQDKGSLLGITGRLTTSTYENKDGYKIKKYNVSTNTIEFLSQKSKTKEANVIEETQSTNPFEEFGESITIDDNFLD